MVQRAERLYRSTLPRIPGRAALLGRIQELDQFWAGTDIDVQRYQDGNILSKRLPMEEHRQALRAERTARAEKSCSSIQTITHKG